MDEHPGDTLGKRFFTFWGALAAILAVALLLGIYRWLFIPSDKEINDAGAGAARATTVVALLLDQKKEMGMVSEVEAGKIVRIPAKDAIPYAAKQLAAQKVVASAIKTPEAIAKAAAATPDPNLLKFQGK